MALAAGRVEGGCVCACGSSRAGRTGGGSSVVHGLIWSSLPYSTEAAVLHPRERLGQRLADGEIAATTDRHPVGEVDVRQVALGEGSDVPELAVVQLAEHGDLPPEDSGVR